ncbi:LexA family transcriptional regulator [Parapedobacter indicus]|uniref:Transcriptional regulator, contains XRE-family HTH domain n=1 Tax=Parapedobacter indicus TaxID=1477437 RepID=A0A1I3QZ72_9SPHI|nr:helix-turn-helix domain-containing protein [Parapedobacter indicus]PPL00308.1 transcriptional regulator with XRE-family HTH domain [Parapedobacter indicus]SFJ39573.1 Transcriptional regulator, contains XRE-family HTH domain [Parapedobacter indicus]
MSTIANNLKYLRKKKKLTQQQFADEMGIKRASVGAYEESRADPKYELLKKIADFYELTMDELANETINDKWKPTPRGNAANVRVLSITVDGDDRENIQLVPVKASAGYLNGYSDPEYVAELPRFSLPMFRQGTYRAFEIKGDSMLPLQPGSVVIAEYLENWNEIKPGQTYVVISRNDGVVYKRIAFKYKEEKGLKLVSDNKTYEPYWVPAADILEIWRAKAYISTQLPEPNPEPTMETLTTMMAQMQKTISNVVDKRDS